MGERTEIAWTDHTWNPWRGCQKVSPGCDNCYMFWDQKRYGRDPDTLVRAAPATFNAPLKWARGASTPPGRSLIFTCSWSDWFHKGADAWRDDAWDVTRQTRAHFLYQILTKRTGLIRSRLPADWGYGYPNIWLGTSVEDQARAGRLAQLLEVRAALYFASLEPLLGRVDLRPFLGWQRGKRPPYWPECPECHQQSLSTVKRDCSCGFNGRKLGWVIVGGESGPGARELDLGALRQVVEQCREARVPVFVKQDSGSKPGQRGRIPDDLWVQEMPEGVRP